MVEISEKFNVEEVKNKMNTLETAFNALSDALSEANKIVNEEVNVGPESALFGELGTILLNTWNENASTFGDFHANFESWAQVVSVIAANNMSFTEETIKAYKDDGSTLTYKDDTTGERKTISSLREEKAQEQTINYVKNNFPEDKYDITENDNALVIKDKNGNTVVEYSMENGKITSTKWYDSDGNYSVITYEVGEDGKLKKNVTYYDANGNVIEKPSSFYEDGTLRPEVSDSAKSENTTDESNGNVDGQTGEGNETGNDNESGEGNETGNDNESGEGNENGDNGQTGESDASGNDAVVVQSGQKVRINGEDAYFIVAIHGVKYYAKNNEPGAIIYILENGKLVEKTDGYRTRGALVNNSKNREDVSWKEEYNNGTSPYDTVYDTVESSFVDGVRHLDATSVNYTQEYLEKESVKISEFKDNLDRYREGGIMLPGVIKLSEYQKISAKHGWFSGNNNISGEKGQDVFLVRNEENNGYYVVNVVDGEASYSTYAKYNGLFISDDELLDSSTTIK